MNEDEFAAAMDAVAQARTERDAATEAAQTAFVDAVVTGYEAGLTIVDLAHASRVSTTTLRARLRERGISPSTTPTEGSDLT